MLRKYKKLYRDNFVMHYTSSRLQIKGKRLIFLFVFILSIHNFIIAHAIHDAASKGDIATIEELIKFKDEINENGDAPIHCSARNVQITAIGILIKSGVLVDIHNSKGETALHIVSSDASRDNSAAIRFLLNRGSCINAQDGNDHYTPMHRAICSNNIAHVEALLNYQTNNHNNRLNLNIADKYNRTPLMLAQAHQEQDIDRVAIIKLLTPQNLDPQFNYAMPAPMPYTQLPYYQLPMPLPYPPMPAMYNPAMFGFSPVPIPYSQFPFPQQPMNIQNQFPLDPAILFAQPMSQQILPAPVQDNQQHEVAPIVSELQERKEEYQEQVQQQEVVEELAQAAEHAAQVIQVDEQSCNNSNISTSGVEVPTAEEIEDEEVFQESVNSQDEVAVRQETLDEQKESDSEDIQDFVQAEMKKEKSGLSKHKLEKQKKADRAKALAAARKKNQAKSNLKVALPKQVQAKVVQQSNTEDYQAEADLIEQEQIEVPQVKKDLRLHDAISKNKKFEEVEPLVTLQGINTSDNEGNFPLHLSVMFKNIDACKKIVEIFADNIADKDELKEKTNAVNGAGRTALYYAIEKKDMEIVDYLLSKDADRALLPKKTNNKLTALAELHARELKALQNASEESQAASVVEISVAASSSEECKESGQSEKLKYDQANLQEILNEQLKQAEEMFVVGFAGAADREYGKFIKAINDGKYNAVKNYVYKNEDYVCWLGEKGTALHCAVASDSKRLDKDFKITKFLVEGDLKSNFKGLPQIIFQEDENGITPFHLAISFSNLNICSYFLSIIQKTNDIIFLKDFVMKLKIFSMKGMVKNPRDINIQQIVGLLQNEQQRIKKEQKPKQPEVVALGSQSNKYLQMDKAELDKALWEHVQHYLRLKLDNLRIDIINMIIAGADLSKCIINEMTYLHIFSQLGDCVIVDLLLIHKANTQALDARGNIPLHYAAARGFLKIIDLLVAKDPETKNAVNKEGNTPLHVCIRHKLAVARLIELGVDTQIKNHELLTPLLFAMMNNEESYKLLSNDLLDKGLTWQKHVMQDVYLVRHDDHDNKFKALDDRMKTILEVIAKSKGIISDESSYLDLDFSGEKPKAILKKKSPEGLQAAQLNRYKIDYSGTEPKILFNGEDALAEAQQ
ncbi:MAG: ankyrin repeat domain-containing protein [Candidatus Babeliales bacterium]|nr:ankyrin repeat domain-containing protein [Candidatus Babeliales bacterium]